MSAPVLNAIAAPGAVASNGAARGGAEPGAAAGFEAVLGALFGDTDAAATAAAATTNAAATATGAVATDAATPPGLAEVADAKDTEPKDETDAADVADGLLAAMGLIVPPAIAPTVATTAAVDASALEPAGGKGGPTAPSSLIPDAAEAALGVAPSATPVGKPQPAVGALGEAPQTATPVSAPVATPQLETAPAAAVDTAPNGQAAAQAQTAAPDAATAAALAPPPARPAADTTPRERARKTTVGAAEPARAEAIAAPRQGPPSVGPTTNAATTAAAKGDAEPIATDAAKTQAKLDAPDAVQAPQESQAPAAVATAAAQPQAILQRGAPETVANLAAKIVKKLDERSTRFDLELDPVGLGRVDVRVEIGQHGRMTAAMSFDTPQAADALRARAGELHKALEQAGFDISGGMTFDVAGQGGRSNQQAAQDQQAGQTGAAFRGRAFQAALDTAGAADARPGTLNLRRSLASGVDIRI